MEILSFDHISFGWPQMLNNSIKKGRKKAPSIEMEDAAKRAFTEGTSLLKLQAIVEIYKVESVRADDIVISRSERPNETLYIGPKAGYLVPANKVAVVLATVGPDIVRRMKEYSNNGDYLMMYYLDTLGVQALHEVASTVRKHIELMAADAGEGVGPFMQPGSVAGWNVEGQRDLYRLGHGERIGLTINDAAMLVPNISDSAIVGIGDHYDSSKVGSMCEECPRKSTCLWRRENISN